MPDPAPIPLEFLDNLNASASWSTLSADHWLRAQHVGLLQRMLNWNRRFLWAACVMIVVMGCFAPNVWQIWAILGVLLLGLGANVWATFVLRQGRIERSGRLLLLLQIGITIIGALLFDNMLIDFAILGLLFTLMANILISPRVSVGIAIGLVIAGTLILYLDVTGSLFFSLHIPWMYEIVLHAFAFVMAIFLGTLLVSQNADNARRALLISVQQACQLENANARLAEEIASRQRAEAARLKLAVEQERVRVLAEFIRDASHEFRHPLAIINADLFLLKRKYPEAADSPHLTSIQEQSAYILSLVEALLEMSRLDEGIDFVRIPVYLPELLRDLTATFTAQLAAQNSQIVLQVEADLPPVVGDGEQINQALGQILRNAVEFTQPDAVVEVTVRRAGDSLAIDVRDEGPGIAPEDLPHIFERFYRGDKARSSRGVGLGLPIVHKIIEHHGGRVDVTSVLGQGSTFTITLPLAEPPGVALPGVPLPAAS